MTDEVKATPREPTEAMIEAGQSYDYDPQEDPYVSVWRAMHDAAPKAESAVTQADRDRAADYLNSRALDWRDITLIREGGWDVHPLVQEFRAHRLAHAPVAAPAGLAEVVGELRTLLAKATPGPWKQIPIFLTSDVLDGIEGQDGHVGGCETDHDAALIVAMRNALPETLAALARPIPAEGQRCDVESNETGCLHPEVHQGRCGYAIPAGEVEQQAISLLAEQYLIYGCADNAEGLHERGPHGPIERAAIAAIKRALQSPANERRDAEIAAEREALELVLPKFPCGLGVTAQPCPATDEYPCCKIRAALALIQPADATEGEG